MSGSSGLFTVSASSSRDTQYDAGARRIELLDYSLAEDQAFVGDDEVRR